MRLRHLLAAALAVSALVPTTASAVDGVILIDQNKALAGNVTPGDAGGFPVTLSQPGSYRLSGNLTVPADTHGILIGNSGVTLDLNGFSITSSGGFGGRGITDNDVARSRITVRNGQVNGFNNSIRLQLSTRVVVEDVMTGTQAAGLSIVTGSHSRIQRNIDASNGLIQAECPSIVTENITAGFITSFVTDPERQCIRYHNRSLNFGGSISE